MKPEDAEKMSDHALLVHTAVSVGVLEERTVGLPELRERVTKVERDVGWLKRISWGICVPIVMSFVGIYIKWFK